MSSYWKRVVMHRLNGSYEETKEAPRDRIVRVARNALNVFPREFSRILLKVGPVVHAERVSGEKWRFFRSSHPSVHHIPSKYSLFVLPWVFWVSLLVRLDCIIQSQRRACQIDRLFEDDFFIYTEIAFVEQLLGAIPSGDIRGQIVEDLTVDQREELSDTPLSTLPSVHPGEAQQERTTATCDVRPTAELGVGHGDFSQGFVTEEILGQHVE